jgi:hypothetical protein
MRGTNWVFKYNVRQISSLNMLVYKPSDYFMYRQV